MKSFIYILIVSLFYLSACGSSSTAEHDHGHEDGTHTHEDGSTHADHEDHEQEEFMVTDSTSHEHMHEDGEDHDH